MNIFVLDKNPEISATMMCDAHVVKMIVESCQILSTVNYLRGNNIGYKPTHIHHPCVQSVYKNNENEKWLINHCSSLLKEYNYRYKKIHASTAIFNKLSELLINERINESGLSLPKCMDDQFKEGGDNINDVVTSYRRYYTHKKKTMHRFSYKNRAIPEWLL
jgi:hypothetical protein